MVPILEDDTIKIRKLNPNKIDYTEVIKDINKSLTEKSSMRYS